jgi:succinyl-CoA synthetase beta subunit
VQERVSPGRLHEIAATARKALVGRGHSAGAEWLAEHEAKELLRTHGVPVPDGRVVLDGDGAVAALWELGGHVALKLSSVDVQHKSELGGVVVGLRSEAEVRAAHRGLVSLARDHGGAVLAERMAAPGVELIVAARTDGIVPALVLGLGGVWTELLDDVAIVPLPAGAPRIEAALRSLRGAPVLLGGRGGTGVDVAGAARLAEAIGVLLVEDRLELIECNPVIVGGVGEGAVAVDAGVRRWRSNCTT